ncbi:MAG: protein kinase [Deltaproteobacteria bacterium]|nr:protein kinase [Deltaproteobacteria bacterium]
MSKLAGLRVGPFELEGELGSGGMADVYAGRHLGQGVPVAVKVVRAEYIDDAVFLSAFGREVRAVAALDHPAIVSVLDSGRIDGAAAAASGGRFLPGSPYLVMRRANRGTLEGLVAPLLWESLPPLVGRLLEGLAHAHARGVIHRDLKPANVLVHREADSAEVWLSDFGIAHQARLGRGTDAFDRGSIVGTPGYMAPEQLLARWRDYGPWTDLYAVGAIVWALLVGRDPFDTSGATPHQALFRRLEQPFPPLPEGIAPPEVGPFLERLTAHDPRRRFQRAADALAQLPGDLRGPLVLPVTGALAQEATTWMADARPASFGGIEPLPSGLAPLEGPSPRMPASHRPSLVAPPPMSVVGAGLGLYGIRHVPLAGRHLERDTLWDGLREVVEGRAFRVALIEGASGVGKSRLADWLAHRADELGLASVLRAGFEVDGTADELARMVAEHLVCVGLPWPRAQRRLEKLLAEQDAWSRYDTRALAQVMAPAFGASDTPTFFSSARQRFLALATWLGRLAERRPVLLLLDDLQWGTDATDFLHFLVHESPIERLLVVATLQSEALERDPDARARFTALGARPEVDLLPLGRLSAEEEERLVHGMLRLDERLAREVSLRSAGHPLHARQLVGELVRRGALLPTASGFQLAPGHELDLPDDLQEVWMRRLTRVVEPGSHDMRALEVAACLGMRVNLDLWRMACEQARFSVRSDLWERMALEGLVRFRSSGARSQAAGESIRPEVGAVEFSHAWLRASLEQAARGHGRWGDCVVHSLAALESGPDTEQTRERRARLLADSGRGREAAPLLRAAAQLRVERSHYTEAYALLDRHEASLDGLEGEGVELERGWGHALRSRLRRLTSRWREAKREAHAAEVIAQRLADDELLASSSSRLGEIAMRQGLLAEADSALARAERLGVQSRDPTFTFMVQWNRAWVRLLRGEPLEAAASFERMARLGRNSEAARRRFIHPLWSHAMALMAALELEQAEQAAALAVTAGRELDHRLALAHALNVQASVALLRGRRQDARAQATESSSLYQAVGSPEAHFSEVLLLRVRLEGGEGEALRESLEQGTERELDLRPFVATRYLGLSLRLALGRGDESAITRDLDRLVGAVRRTQVVDPFIARDLLLGLHAASVPEPLRERLTSTAEVHLSGLRPDPRARAQARWAAGLSTL